MTNLLSNTFRRFANWRRSRSLNQLSRDFALIMARARSENTPQDLDAIAERLRHHLDKANLRVHERVDNPQLVLYDLTQTNRAARQHNDQIEFNAMTLAVIAFRAKCIELASVDNVANTDPAQARGFGPLQREVDGFLASPAGQGEQIDA